MKNENENDNTTSRHDRRDDNENIINHIYVNHISQLEKDMIGIKKEQEFQSRDLNTLKGLVHELVTKMDVGLALTRKTWWLLVGITLSMGVVGAVIQIFTPIITTAG